MGEVTSKMATEQVTETKYVDPEKLVLGFYEDCKIRGLAEMTIFNYGGITKKFLAFLEVRKTHPFDVDKLLLRDYIAYERGEGMSDKTLDNNFAALSTFYNYLDFEGFVKGNPVLVVRKRYLKAYKEESEDDPVRKLISVEEMSLFVNSILNVRDRALVAVMAKTGVRRGEVVRMDIGDVEWVEQTITLKKKTFKKRSNRVVFFDDECARALKRWVKMREMMNPKSDALFLGEEGGRLKRSGIYKMVVKYAEKMGLHDPSSERVEDHFTPHCFRHWFTTWLLRNGMSREYVKVLRGDRRSEAIDVHHRIDREDLRKSCLMFIPQIASSNLALAALPPKFREVRKRT